MSLEQIGGVLAIVTVIYTIWKDWPEIKRRVARPSPSRPGTTYHYSYYRRGDTPGVVIARHLILSMGLFGFLGFFAALNDPNMSRNMAAFMGAVLGATAGIFFGAVAKIL